MKWFPLLACLGLTLPCTASPQASVTVTVEPGANATSIPLDFVGLSFGMRALLPDGDGNHFFSPTNKPLVMLFRNIGISHLRVGGTTVESPPTTPIPDHAAIDDLFAFVQAAGIKKVLYSFRLLETNSDLHYDATNAALAKYIWDHHRDQLDCFAIANEPDLQRVFKQDFEVRDFATYLAKWRRFAAAITNAVPEAKFAGPDAASPNGRWTTDFAEKLKDTGMLSIITEHYYPGGAGRNVSPEKGIDDMLSSKWNGNYEGICQKTEVPLLKLGLPYRFTEANDHYSGGVKGGSETFAGALWALDFLHWWMAHGTSGVDFHNTQWVVNDVITLDESREAAPNPKAYGLKAFELGSRGIPEPVKIENPSQVNLTAYAALNVSAANGTSAFFFTLINKEHGPGAREADVTVALPDKVKHAEVIYLVSPENDAAAKTGITLCGAPIHNKGPWHGAWTSLSLSQSGKCVVKVSPASAAIVKITAP
jgi:hypothetical protein